MATSTSATPTSPAKQRTQSIGALLEPWIEEFAKYGHAKITTSRSEATITIEFVFLTLSSGHTTRDEVIALREALEVMHIASLLDVRDVEEALSGLSYHDFEPAEQDEEYPAQVTRETKAKEDSVTFVLTFYGTSGRFLDQVVAPVFFTETYDHSEAFKNTVNALGWEESTTTSLMPLQCRVNLVSMDNDFEDEPETDFVERVASFLHQLDGLSKEKESSSGPEDEDRVEIRVAGVDLDLNQMGVSKPVIEAAAHLKEVSLHVRCSRVALDPRALSCSAAELSSFLESLGSQTTEMTVEIGHLLISEPTDSLEGNQEDVIEKVFRGIAGASCVTSVSFGPLLAMMDSLSNRKALWMELFTSLAGESTRAPISSLVLSPQIQLLEEDAGFINDAVAAAGRGLTVKSVKMWMSQSPPASVQALIKAVGCRAEEVALHNDAQELTSSETVRHIVSECPELRDLTLSSAEIDSLAVFTEKSTRLRSLSLGSVMVKDMDSVSHFFMTLSDPSTLLAKHLLKLQIKIANHIPHSLVIDDEEALVVADMLMLNKTLRHLELTMSDETSTTTMAAIHKHHKEVLSEPLLLTQKLAFASVIQPLGNDSSESCRSRVDQDVVQLIFEYAAAPVLRRVELDW